MGTSGSAKSDSAVKAILIAVVVALIAGSSAPWWWTKVFPPPAQRIPDPNPAPPTDLGVGACSTGAKPSNVFHDAPAPNGSWDWNCNGQIERQYGACENLSRSQCDPNSNAAGGPGGFCTEIRGPGGCAPQVAECGAKGFMYPCFYNPADGRCHAGGYEIAMPMRCQ